MKMNISLEAACEDVDVWRKSVKMRKSAKK
jgi:hypothetical protein